MLFRTTLRGALAIVIGALATGCVMVPGSTQVASAAAVSGPGCVLSKSRLETIVGEILYFAYDGGSCAFSDSRGLHGIWGYFQFFSPSIAQSGCSGQANVPQAGNYNVTEPEGCWNGTANGTLFITNAIADGRGVGLNISNGSVPPRAIPKHILRYVPIVALALYRWLAAHPKAGPP